MAVCRLCALCSLRQVWCWFSF